MSDNKSSPACLQEIELVSSLSETQAAILHMEPPTLSSYNNQQQQEVSELPSSSGYVSSFSSSVWESINLSDSQSALMKSLEFSASLASNSMASKTSEEKQIQSVEEETFYTNQNHLSKKEESEWIIIDETGVSAEDFNGKMAYDVKSSFCPLECLK